MLDLTRGDIVIIGIALALVLLPSRLNWIGNTLGRLLKGKPSGG